MKFLLIKPGEQKTRDIFSIYEPTTHPPLGLLYLGGILEQDGHEVEVLDFNMENVTKEQLRNVITSSDAVGMTVYSYDYKSAQNISSMIKDIDTNIPLVIGGPHCTFIQEKSLNDIPEKVKTAFLKVIEENVEISTVNIIGKIKLINTDGDGIDKIKDTLESIVNTVEKPKETRRLNISYLGAPYYRLEIVSKDYLDAENILSGAIEVLEDKAKKYNNTYEFNRD